MMRNDMKNINYVGIFPQQNMLLIHCIQCQYCKCEKSMCLFLCRINKDYSSIIMFQVSLSKISMSDFYFIQFFLNSAVSSSSHIPKLVSELQTCIVCYEWSKFVHKVLKSDTRVCEIYIQAFLELPHYL